MDTIGPILAFTSMLYCTLQIVVMIRDSRINNKAVEAAKREQMEYMTAQKEYWIRRQLEASERAKGVGE